MIKNLLVLLLTSSLLLGLSACSKSEETAHKESKERLLGKRPQ